MMKMMMMRRRTAAMIAASMVAMIGGIGMKNHKKEVSATPPLHRNNHLPCMSSD
jgi:hypothetical protein